MIAYLGLGANLGERVKNLWRAIELIKNLRDVELLRVSSFYETAAWGVTNQPDFINAAVKIRTALEPLKLLDALQSIEVGIEGTRHEHWAARLIDVDILFIEGQEINSERLTVPHKFLRERDFAMIPLAEISPLKFALRGERVRKICGSPLDFELKMIACVDKNFGMGYKGELLFRIAEDLQNFRRLTLNNTVIYGRRTLKTFPEGKPLALRRNIIFSRSLRDIEGAEVVNSVTELWENLSTHSSVNFVIGGGEIFRELLPYATEIYLTVVDEVKISDVTFPAFAEEFLLDTSYQLLAKKYKRVDYAK